MKESFESDPNKEYYRAKYEGEFMRYLQRIVESVENRIIRSNDRISAASSYPGDSTNTHTKELTQISERVAQLLKRADEAGEKVIYSFILSG